MHISKIVIQGFKTYKDTTIIDLISPRHNVVVGRNGSGKSNFFAAIRFVLSDAYTHMTREERQGLIHEGSGTVMSAFVEIHFDNSDGRFPINKSNVTIRRTIGLKKDDYALDGKSATRSDVMNLLESAGFSRSNPYYIVPQGRITSLTNSKDDERLALLKEVSGATVFENKLKESVKEMNNSNYKKLRIDETLTSIDEKLSDLQIESSDLKDFQKLDKSKKVLQYKLYDREFTELTESIEVVEEDYNRLIEEQSRYLKDLEKREKLCLELTTSINTLKISLKISALEKEQVELDYNQILKNFADQEVSIEELKLKSLSARESFDIIETNIANYQDKIHNHELKIALIKPSLIDIKEREKVIKEALSKLVMRQRGLYSKQNRFLKFKNKRERDTWLNLQLSLIKGKNQSKEFELNQLLLEIRDRENTLEQLDDEISKINELLDSKVTTKAITETRSSVVVLKSKINDFNDRRKFLWREDVRLRSIHESIKNDVIKATDLVNQSMDRAQAQGLNAVTEIVARLTLSQNVYGSLADAFSVNEKYKTAAEVVAGNSLFNIIVDTDKTASIIMDELIRTKAGRITFMPLNRIQVQTVTYPDSNEHQCIPLLKKLKYNDGKVGRAIRHVFAKTIVCADLQKGSELARLHSLTAITLDGDRADTRGVISGGYRDYKKSRLDAMKIQTKKMEELKQTEEEIRKCAVETEALSQQLTSTNNELQLLLRDLEKLQSDQEPLKIKLAQLSSQKFNIEQELKTLKLNAEAAKSAKLGFINAIKQHETELNSKFTDSLSEEEVQDLEGLSKEIKLYEEELDSIVTQLAEIETEITTFESELINNFHPQLQKLISERNCILNRYNSREDVLELEKELDAKRKKLESLQLKREQINKVYDQLLKEISESESTLDRENNHQHDIIKKIASLSKMSEKALNKNSIMANRRSEVQKNIRDLGVLPEEAFQLTEYDKLSSDRLVKKLNSIDDSIAKYSHINKKALEQFSIFTKQREDMANRRQELERSRESIEKLMEKLQTQKDEAIRKSFVMVAKSFNEIFGNLVPLGVGHLVMQKSVKPLNDSQSVLNHETFEDIDGEELEVGTAATKIDNYIGVSIKVSFNSKHDDQQRIEQLSGGQKSLCAIALILAIQKCDPAPFYLFDEVDANLDTQYRTAVASMIQGLSSSAQFICTTFRPEMLQVADKFYGIIFSNKVSTVSEINREQAMSFVEGQANH